MPATPAWPPKSLPRLFVRTPLADGAAVELEAGQANYLRNVMRLGEGDETLLFDGASGVRLPDGLIAGPSYSVALWVRPDVITPFTTTFFGARDPNNWVSMVPQGPVGGQTMLWSGTAWYDGVTGTQIPAGQWSHLAFTVDAGAVKVYVDGVEKFSGVNFPNVFTTANGAFALGVMMIPIIVRSAEESMKLVPDNIRQASYALGANRMQTTLRIILPAALPAIVTGVFLAIGRIAGETAPLLMIGMVSFVPGVPEGFTGAATVLPVQVFIWENASERAFHERTAAAIIVLLVFMIVMNAAAVILRRRFERRW